MGYKINLKPRAERETTIAKRLENSTEDGDPIYDFRSGKLVPKVISLEIDLPVYRMENCRTFSAQQSAIATEGHDKHFFTKGQEKTTAQQAQHEILEKLANKGSGSVTPIIEVLRDEGQREAILVTSTGVVVNGNRRLSAMRALYDEGGKHAKTFAYVKCAILPPDTTPDEIDDIEADLQAKRETKLDYDWIGDARLVRRQVNKNGKIEDVAKRLNRKKKEIEVVLQALDEADLYLSEWVEKPGQYDLVSGEGEQMFSDMAKHITKDPSLQTASRAIAWSLFENRGEITGRVYAYNAAFGKLAPQVLEELSDELDLTDEDSIADDDDGFAIDIDEDEDSADFDPIVKALKSEDATIKADAFSALLSACDSALERERGQKNEKAALKALSNAQAKLAGIDALTAGQGTLPAMLKQIDSIRNVLKNIEDKVKLRQTGGSSSDTFNT